MSTHELKISPGAAKRILHLLAVEQNEGLKFRVYITGGGCSGFQYGFAFENYAQPDDIIIQQQVSAQTPEGEEQSALVEIVVDPMSMTYLDGAQINFKEGLYGSHFSVDNPNVSNTCGCGNSFSIG